MPQINSSWRYTLVHGPDGGTRAVKVEAFTIAHGESHHQVIATGEIEFPNPELGKVLVAALAEAIGKMGEPIVIPATRLPNLRN